MLKENQPLSSLGHRFETCQQALDLWVYYGSRKQKNLLYETRKYYGILYIIEMTLKCIETFIMNFETLVTDSIENSIMTRVT